MKKLILILTCCLTVVPLFCQTDFAVNSIPGFQTIESKKKSQAITTIKVYKNLKRALRHPEKVVALDLSGKKLKTLPKEIGELQNLEFLWLDPRLRNLWLYPRAWPYKIFGKRLPGGGYAHLHGRGGGKFYIQNYLTTLPDEILELKKLKLINLCNSDVEIKEWIPKLKKTNPEMIILSFDYDTWDKVELESDKYMTLKAQYKFKNKK